jgi:hypothetical protein
MISNNQELANCFREAINHLWDGKFGPSADKPYSSKRFICHAIEATAIAGAVSVDTSRRAKSIIKKGIGGEVFAEDWLKARDIYVTDFVKMQAWRKQWLELLVAQYEGK